MLRERLEPLVGQTIEVRGTVAQRSHWIYGDRHVKTICISYPLNVAQNQTISNHAWVHHAIPFDLADAEAGDRVQFFATVIEYTKNLVKGNPQAGKMSCFGLAHPTDIRILEKYIDIIDRQNQINADAEQEVEAELAPVPPPEEAVAPVAAPSLPEEATPMNVMPHNIKPDTRSKEFKFGKKQCPSCKMFIGVRSFACYCGHSFQINKVSPSAPAINPATTVSTPEVPRHNNMSDLVAEVSTLVERFGADKVKKCLAFIEG